MLPQNNPVSILIRTEILRGLKIPKGETVHMSKYRSFVHMPFLLMLLNAYHLDIQSNYQHITETESFSPPLLEVALYL